MSQRDQHDNSGILFRNDKKTRDTDRDYSGSATIGGVEYWMSGWVKQAKNGSKFLTFSFKAKDAPKAESTKPAAVQSGVGVPFNDEIPFAPEWRG
jgi:hypothetical protein